MPLDENERPDAAIVEALKSYNQISVSSSPPPFSHLSLPPTIYLNLSLLQDQQYQLLKPGSVTPVLLDKCILNHVDFIAKQYQVDDAPEELFFAEVIFPEGTLDSCVRFCVAMGPRDSISGLFLTCICGHVILSMSYHY